jgi:tight adherence protein C
MTALMLLTALVLLTAAVALLLRAISIPRLRAADNLGKIDEYGYEGRPQPDDSSDGVLVGPLDVLAGIVGAALAVRLPLMRVEDVRKELRAAGLYRVEPRKLMGYQILVSVALTVLWVWSSAVRSAPGGPTFLGSLACLAGGWYAPLMLVKRRARFRLQRIEYELPELVDLLVVAVEAGLGFSAALRAASGRLMGPLGDEVRMALQEQRMGLTTVEAMKNMLGRCDTPAMRSFVRAMVQGEQLGISIGQILRNIADEMRKRRRAAAEERAQKAPVKLLFPLVFLIFPAMFVILLGPAIYAFLDALG